MKRIALNLTFVSVMFALAGINPANAAVDAAAAEKLFKGNDCAKCHAPDRTKKGPSLKKIAEKYKGKADGKDMTIKNMTEGKKVKLDDGTQEDHKVIDTKDPKQLQNLAEWILSR